MKLPRFPLRRHSNGNGAAPPHSAQPHLAPGTAATGNAATGTTAPGTTAPGATATGTAATGNGADPVTALGDGSGLVVQDLHKSYNNRKVLGGVSLNLHRGEAVGLLGPNGAGKTTCFYIVTGLIAAEHGTIRLDGRDVTRLPMYRRAQLGLGYLPQESSVFRGMTVADNLRAVLELVEPNKSAREDIVEALLEEFRIVGLRNAPAMALSGGERRRVEIARALAARPHFILLDEPLAGIDPIAVNDIRNLVSHLKDRGIGVLITDHKVRETLDIIDRAYIIHDGRVLTEGLPAEIVANADVRRVYLGEGFSL